MVMAALRREPVPIRVSRTEKDMVAESEVVELDGPSVVEKFILCFSSCYTY